MRNLCLLVLVGFVITGCGSNAAQGEATRGGPRIQTALAKQMEQTGASEETVDVIINFRQPSQSANTSNQQRYRKQQDDLLARHPEGLTVKRRYQHVPAIAARISRSAFEKLRHDPDIDYIQLDGEGGGASQETKDQKSH